MKEADLRNEFFKIAIQRFENAIDRGEGIRWEDMMAYLKARSRGRAHPRPIAKPLDSRFRGNDNS